MPRRGTDLLLGIAWPARRYRCRSCGWAGLQLRAPEQRPAALARLAVTVLLAVTTVTLVVTALRDGSPDDPGMQMIGGQAFMAGEHFAGVAVPRSHPLVEARGEQVPPQPVTPDAGEPGSETSKLREPPGRAGLALRRYCAWGEPGRSAYAGTVRQALRAAGLPEEVVDRVTDDVSAGLARDRISIRRGLVQADDSGLRFDPRRIALTLDMTLCLDAAINFATHHAEGADLFVATDDLERTHYVMVTHTGGHVGVLRLLDGQAVKGDG